jgi:phosphoribosylaminoimidazolecarboxamide formyltransferase/IMP cyclohydrolase
LTKQFTKESIADGQVLRYGENPHQKAFFGDFDAMFKKFMEKNCRITIY